MKSSRQILWSRPSGGHAASFTSYVFVFFHWTFVLVIQVSCFFGCSQGNKLGTVPVAGKVTYKGQPVPGATVSFIPEGEGRPATAISGADGAYQLATLDAVGAMPGHYSVLVRKSDTAENSTKPVTMEEALKLNSRPAAASKELLPSKYGDTTKTPLKFEVKKGRGNTFDLPLAD